MQGLVIGSEFEDCAARMGHSLFAGLMRYAEEHIETGGFLRAVLENDFDRAIAHAHPSVTMGALKAIRKLITGSFPPASYGSPEKVAAWIAAGQLAPEANMEQIAEKVYAVVAELQGRRAAVLEEQQAPIVSAITMLEVFSLLGIDSDMICLALGALAAQKRIKVVGKDDGGRYTFLLAEQGCES